MGPGCCRAIQSIEQLIGEGEGEAGGGGREDTSIGDLEDELPKRKKKRVNVEKSSADLEVE